MPDLSHKAEQIIALALTGTQHQHFSLLCMLYLFITLA